MVPRDFAVKAISRSAGHAMSKIVNLQAMRHSRTAPGPRWPNAIDAKTRNAPSDDASQLLLLKEEVFRAILLLNVAVQHARLLLKNVSEPSRSENFEAQITTIEQQLKLARQIALKL
jgi:hypothetical protein